MGDSRDDTQTQGFRLLWPTISIVAVALLGYMVYEPPLESARPTSSSGKLPAPPSPKGMTSEFARLWEDPLQATISAPNDEVSHSTCISSFRSFFDTSAVRQENDRRGVRSVLEHLVNAAKAEHKSVHVIPVLVSGAPYANDREQRMRMRYAVLSALGANGYRLALPERMTYIVAPICTYIRAADEWKTVPLRIPIKLYDRDEVASENVGLHGTRNQRVVVLWINETQLGDHPVNAVAQVLDYLFDKSEIRRQVKVSLIGPTTSGGLVAMAKEVCAKPDLTADKTESLGVTNLSHDFREFSIYSPRATISPQDLTQTGDPSESEVLSYFTDPLEAKLWSDADGELKRSKSDGKAVLGADENNADKDRTAATPVVPEVVRTIGTDRDLVYALERELQLRHAFPRFHGDTRHVVLITERDTLYGRSLRSAFAFDEKRGIIGGGVPKQNLHVFTYLRGLDGEMPSRSAKQDEVQPAGSIPANREERPEGSSQLDYLQRLVMQIQQLQQNLVSQGNGEITAVGVMGTDVYDKLLVLRALRTHFPRAWFFTTDLDAALFQARERDFSRNVLVASHFALQLHPALQRDVPAFRDSYQTSMFYTMLIVLGDPTISKIYSDPDQTGRRDPWRTHRSSQGVSAVYFLTPLVFEISRHGPYQLTATGGPKTQEDLHMLLAQPAQSRSVAALVHPVSPQEVSAETVPRQWALTIFAAVLFWATICSVHTKCRKNSAPLVASVLRVVRWRRVELLDWLIFLSIVVLILFAVAVYYDSNVNPDGEPWEWSAGISIWPTTLLRLIVLILSIVLTIKGYRDLKSSERELEHQFKLASSDDTDNADEGGELLRRSWQLFRGQFSFARSCVMCWSSLLFDRDKLMRWQSVIEKWKWVRRNSHWKIRVVRTAPAVVLFFGAGFLLMRLWGFPFNPARGDFSFFASEWIVRGAVIAMLVLLFFVLDAIQLCRVYISTLMRQNNRWPVAAVDALQRGTAYPVPIATELLSIRFTAQMTQAVGKLVIYPFLVVSLMIVSRLRIFDAWDIPWSLVAIFTAMLISIIWASFSLRNTAEAGRKFVLERLHNGLALHIGPEATTIVERYKQAIEEVQRERRGSFRPVMEDPIIRALLIPFGGFGGVVAIEQFGRFLSM